MRQRSFLVFILLLAPSTAAQAPPRFKSAADEKAFEKAQDEYLQVLGRITELREKASPTDAEKREKVYLRKRLLDLARITMTLLAQKAKPEPRLAPAAERPLSKLEQGLLERAEKLIEIDFVKQGAKRLPISTSKIEVKGAILLDHPCLPALPDHRFYLAKYQLWFPGEKSKDRHHFVYQFVVFDVRADSLRINYGFGPSAPVRQLLDAGVLRAPNKAAAAKIQLAKTVLWKASMGANVSRAKGSTGLSRAQLDHRFGLGKFAAEHEAFPHQVIETASERVLLTWRLHADDFGMPLHLFFEWDRFAKKDGRWLGKDRKLVTPAFAREIKIDDAEVKAKVAEFAKTL